MFKPMQKLIAGALCAFALATVAMTPAHADPQVLYAGRAGAVLNVDAEGNTQLAAAIAQEFQGLIHVLNQETSTGVYYWKIKTRDGQYVLVDADIESNPQTGALYFDGKITDGALAGVEVYGEPYVVDNRYMVYLEIYFGSGVVWFTQELSPLR